MCKEHPYHCLLPLYCLGPSSRQSIKTPRTTSSSQSQSSHSSAPIENLSANRLWDALLGAEAKYSNRVRNVQRACDGCLEWAEFPIKDQVDNPHEIKEKAKRRKKLPTDSDGKYFLPKTLQKLPQLRNIKVPIITAHIPLDKTGKYDDFVHIQSYDNVFAVAGGLSRPKIIYCTGSDGKRYKQLFKGEGNDDLRQDAVMEQVFALMNKCLHRDREAKKRKLRVRDYKVVPLAAQAGVLEFVSHTEPLDNCLKGAHIRYTPENPSLGSDIACALKECRESCNKKRWSPQQRNKALTDLFLEYRSRFPPVMRHFFTERYKLPSVWFSARLNYSRSAATTSMVGHVLGLGDRHLQNILIDDKGELVHIDLGISFEQGKLLPVPEAVPFRLTADMVDGLGTSGTQGVFQRCAEETLRVLRDNSGTIMTVLEVFKHDPLYSWIPSKERKERAQPAGPISEYADAAFRLAGIDLPSGLVEEAADRSLNTVNRKLTKGASIEFTVNELIAEATDPANLANMFIGWSPQY